jgi:hypothetical protein
MGISVANVGRLLDRKGIQYRLAQDDFGGMFTFQWASSLSDISTVDVVIRVVESGRLLRVEIPMGYSLSATPHRAAVLQALMKVQGGCRILRYELREGEILPQADLVLEDCEATSGQFDMFMTLVINGACRHHKVIQQALESGVVSLQSVEPADPGEVETPIDTVSRVMKLAEHVGGLEALERLVRLHGGRADMVSDGDRAQEGGDAGPSR